MVQISKVNFEPIGEALQAFDTDKIDVARVTPAANLDGTTGQTGITTNLYTGLPCHIAFMTEDEANAQASQTNPIQLKLKINCSVNTDIRNGDYVTAYKLDNFGNILKTYSGVISEVIVTQSRKSAQLQVKTNI